MSAAARASTVHATCVLVGPVGVLIRGPSGAGKSSLALALVERAAGLGRFAVLVADDRVHLTAQGGVVVARVPPVLAGRIERRGLGILAVDYEPAAVVGLVADFVAEDVPERLPEAAPDHVRLCGLAVRRLALPRDIFAAAGLILAVLGRNPVVLTAR